MTVAAGVRKAIETFVLPFLYFAGVVPVVIALVVALTFVEHNVGWPGYAPGIGLDDFTTLYFNGDVVGMFSLVLMGVPLFGLLSYWLARLEERRPPPLRAHLRHCAFLYAFIVILGIALAAELVGNLLAGNTMYEVPKALVLWVVAGYAIVVDVLVFLWLRRASQRANVGGTT